MIIDNKNPVKFHFFPPFLVRFKKKLYLCHIFNYMHNIKTMRHLLLMIVLTVGMTVQARENNDTTVIENATQYRDSTSVKKTYEYDEYTSSNWDIDFGLGWAIPTNVPDEIGFSTFRSWEWILGVRYCYTPKKSLQTYSTGLWVNWRGYTLSGDNAFAKGDQSVVEIGEFPENASHKHSSINIFSLSVPFFFTQKFGQKSKFKLTLGPVVNFNLRGRVNNDYDIGDDEFEISTKGIEYRTLTVDLMGFISYSNVSIYCKYSPMSVLKTDKGPQFHSLTLGVFF